MFVVGGRQFTSQVMQKNCHEFIAYENLVRRRDTVPGPRRENGASGPADVGKAIPLVKRALKVLSDREVSPQLGLLKSTLLQLDSTFSERDYGVSTFRDFIEKLAKTGVVTLRHAGRSMMVDAVETESGSRLAPSQEAAADQGSPVGGGQADVSPLASESGEPVSSPSASAAASPAARDSEQIQQIVDYTRDVFSRAPQAPRWPMYVRQFKQYVRGVDGGFDEHKWSFATIMEFLRALQREGLFRLERDRRGQIRVFPGAMLQKAAGATSQSVDGQADDVRDVIEAEPVEMQDEIVQGEPVEEPLETEAMASETIEVQQSEPAPPRSRRVRKAPAAGRPAARKSTGAKPSKRRKTLVPA